MSGAVPHADQSPDPPEHPATGELGVWPRIREHKIIQWALGYLAAALALTHAEELVARAFEWPEFISRALIVVLALGLPIAITLAWYHGHRASRHVTGAEASIIAILLLIGSGLLWALVRPHEPAVTQSVPEDAAPPIASPVAPAAVPVTPASTAAPLVPPPASGKPRIAILPFHNLSPDPANAFFTDGLHEEIISTLSNRAPDLEVISSTTMMTYSTAKPVKEIARELGATHVLEGSVSREGSEVRLTLQLIDARRDQHLWSQDYNRTLKRALTLQSEVANEVASQLSLKLSGDTQPLKAPTASAQGYDLYLKALLKLRNGDRANVQETLHLFTQALAYDPNFALAYAQRARARIVMYGRNTDVSEDNLRAIREDLAASQRLAPNNPTVLYARAFFEFVDRQPIERVQASYRAADAAGGADPVWLVVEAIAFAVGPSGADDSSRLLERAVALDPADRTLLGLASGLYVRIRRPADALRVIDLQLAQFPSAFAARARADVLNKFAGTPLPVSLDWTSRDPLELESNSEVLRRAQRYRDLESLLAALPYDSFPVANEFRGGVGMRPTAEPRGWLQMLLGNRTLAMEAGREVLEFVARQRPTRANATFLQLLSAEGWLFSGGPERARTTARAAASGQVDEGAFPVSPQMRSQIAQVLAWAGAPDEATDILEQLSVSIPGLAPGQIARDPLYTVPLAGNPRYQALKAKLEAQMAATKLE